MQAGAHSRLWIYNLWTHLLPCLLMGYKITSKKKLLDVPSCGSRCNLPVGRFVFLSSLANPTLSLQWTTISKSVPLNGTHSLVSSQGYSLNPIWVPPPPSSIFSNDGDPSYIAISQNFKSVLHREHGRDGSAFLPFLLLLFSSIWWVILTKSIIVLISTTQRHVWLISWHHSRTSENTGTASHVCSIHLYSYTTGIYGD